MPSWLALMMVALLVRWNGDAAHDVEKAGVLVVLAAATVVLLAPVMFQLHQFTGARAAPIIGGFAAVAALPLVPLVDIIGTPNRVWLPALAAGLAAVLVGVGLTGRSPSPDRPTPANVFHVQASALGGAVWAVPISHDNAITRQFVGTGADTVSLESISRVIRGRYF